MSRNIRNSSKALVIQDGKMLAIKLRDSDGEWYIMPGGGQEAEELLSTAACREVAEEMGILVECKELLFVIEGLNGEKFHRVDLVFLKYHRNVLVLQLADVFQAIQRIPGKPADGLGDDHVNVACHARFDHTIELFAVFGVLI